MEQGKRTALITGASSGIGRELAVCFARGGHNVVLVARDKARLEMLAEELRRDHSITALVVPKDLSSPSAPDELFREVERQAVQVDYLVNNAGFGMNEAFSRTPPEKDLGMIQVNITSLTHLTKLFLPGMIGRKYGKVLNLASTAAFMPGAFNAVYFATKAYVLSFSEAIAEELKGSGVTVTALCPGATETEFARRAELADAALFKLNVMGAKEVAAIGYRAMMCGKTSAVAGMANKALVFSIRFTPRWMVMKVTKMLSDGRKSVKG